MKDPTRAFGPAAGEVARPTTEGRPWSHDELRAALLGWFRGHARELGFRTSKDPWATLVAEVMAQQTQVARVVPAWEAFMARFPTASALAEAATSDVLRAWGGLGYNRRALLLQRAASDIVARHAGRVPGAVADLEALPGVGPYTARAVAAIAFGLPVAAIDTNVRRAVSRLVGRPDASIAEIRPYAEALVDPEAPGTWTHALMDLGASVCRPRRPRCPACPWRTACPGPGEDPDPPLARTRNAGRLVGRARAPAFERTARWLRGRIVAHLREVKDDGWSRLPAVMGDHDVTAIAAATEALARDGLVERRADGAVRLPSHPS